MADNNLRIYGNLTRDPELRFTPGGTAACNFGVAVNRRYQQNNEWVEAPTQFFNVTVWGQLGENVASSLAKGDRAMVEGRLEFRKYTDKDGIERSSHDVIADEVCPSLKWATAQLQRTTRDGGNVGGARGPATSRPPADPQGGGGYGRPADPIYGDEEPF